VTVLIAISSVHDVLYNVENNALKRNQESLKTSTVCTGCSTGKQVPHKILKKTARIVRSMKNMTSRAERFNGCRGKTLFRRRNVARWLESTT